MLLNPYVPSCVGRLRSASRFLARVLPGAKPAPFLGFIEPALAALVDRMRRHPGLQGVIFGTRRELGVFTLKTHTHNAGQERLLSREKAGNLPFTAIKSLGVAHVGVECGTHRLAEKLS